MKQRKLNIFQTVNNARVLWDPLAKPKGLLGGHLNICSVIAKSDQIKHLLLKSNLDFLFLSETWLHSNSPSAVPDYNIFRKDRPEGKGGGLMCYIRDTIQCNLIHWSHDVNLECMDLIVTLSPQMHFTLLGLYRPPNSKSVFYDQLDSVLRECNFNKEVFLMGDFNINYEAKKM